MTKTVRRMVLLFGGLLLGATLTAGTAGAQTQSSSPGPDDNYTSCATFNVSNPTPAAGDTIHVSGNTPTPNAHVVIVLTDQDGGHIVGETDSNASNFFEADITIPTTSTGTVKVQAFQTGDNTDPLVGCDAQVASLDITAPAGEELARTGSPNSTMPLARLGIGLLAAGGLALLVARRRRASTSA